jgi:Uncharacterised protein family (UPF0175)
MSRRPTSQCGKRPWSSILFELYRRETISSRKTAELLNMPRLDFVRYASQLGISFIDMPADEWDAEKAALPGGEDSHAKQP